MHLVQVEPGEPYARALAFPSQKQGKTTSYLGPGG